MTALEKLQDLLPELFQLDQADLDFGLYRLFRIKRNEVEHQLQAEHRFDEMLINGDMAKPGVRSLDGLFKRLIDDEEP